MRQRALACMAVWLGISAGVVSTAAGQDSKPAVAAEVNGVAITMAEVEEGAAQNLAKLEEQIYQIKRTRLDALIEDRLLASEAKKRGISTTALIEAEITKQVAPVPAEEVAAFHETNKAKLQGDLAKWEGQIRTYLTGQRVAVRRQAFIKTLRDTADVKVMIAPPPVFRATVSVAGAPVRGAETAPVTLIEFSDFHCPFCRQVQPVLKQLLTKYGQDLRIVYKDLPIDSLHPQARLASEAARCAGDQGRFWEYHDRLYVGGSDASPAILQQIAKEVGVADAAQFETCRSSRKYQAAVQKDVQEGATLGINGTPGFFVNGRFLSGAQPIENFIRVIDEELAAAAKTPRSGKDASPAADVQRRQNDSSR